MSTTPVAPASHSAKPAVAQKVLGTWDIALLLFLGMVWGSSFTAIKFAIDELSAVWIVIIRLMVAAAVVLTATLFVQAKYQWSSRDLTTLFVVAATGNVLPFFFTSVAVETLPASAVALLMAGGPFLGLVMAHILHEDERITLYKTVGVLLGFCGVALVFGFGAFTGANTPVILLAKTLAVLAGACYIISALASRRLDHMDRLAMTATVLVIGVFQLLPFGLFLGDGVPDFSNLSLQTWLTVLYLGLLPTGLAVLLRFQLIRRVGASNMSMVGYLVPVFGVGIAALVLGETLSWTVLVALGLIILGLFITRLQKAQP